MTITLPVAEVFGPTFQGEGPHTGKPVSFLRLGLCNLSCEWCDTPYTWDTSRYDVKAECPDTPLSDILDRLCAIPARTVVVTGGEPLLHHHKLGELLEQGYLTGLDWHVETNGTIPPPDWWAGRVEHTTVSPKINTRDPEKKRLKPRALQGWSIYAQAGYACFKFVAQHPRDLDVVDALVETYRIPHRAVWVMPEGTTPDAVLRTHRTIADAVLARGYHTTTRLHTLLWGDERGH